MGTTDKVRALFDGASIVEWIENTYNPRLNGTRRQIVHAGVRVLDCEDAAGAAFRLELPSRARDVIALDDQSVTYKLGDIERLAGHTVTLRVI